MVALLKKFSVTAVTEEYKDEILVARTLDEKNRRRVEHIVRDRYFEYKMKIILTSDVPIRCGPRRLSFDEKREVQKIIDDLLSKGYIRPSCSEYTSPVVLVKKKSGELRMCVDYRLLNKITVRDNYPLPLIDDCLLYLSNKKYFSSIDLKSAFNQMSLHEDSIKYTSFVLPNAQYEWTTAPFGLKNCPAV